MIIQIYWFVSKLGIPENNQKKGWTMRWTIIFGVSPFWALYLMFMLFLFVFVWTCCINMCPFSYRPGSRKLLGFEERMRHPQNRLGRSVHAHLWKAVAQTPSFGAVVCLNLGFSHPWNFINERRTSRKNIGNHGSPFCSDFFGGIFKKKILTKLPTKPLTQQLLGLVFLSLVQAWSEHMTGQSQAWKQGGSLQSGMEAFFSPADDAINWQNRLPASHARACMPPWAESVGSCLF